MSVATAAEVLESFSPATGRRLGGVEQTAPGDVQRVVDEVAQVQPIWAQLLPRERARYLVRAAQAILDDIDDIRDLIVARAGQDAHRGLPDGDRAHRSMRCTGWPTQGPEILADEKIRSPQPFFKTKRSAFTYEPLGVVGVIAPWNYPWTIPLGEVAIALMAGNGVVLKPASLTCLIGQRIQRDVRACRPARGNRARGPRRRGGGPGTGRVQRGQGVLHRFGRGGSRRGEACARLMKGSVLELGGKDPMIVLADADLPNAVGGALWGGFANAGQTCSGIERVYVMREVADRFVADVVAGAKRLTVGDPRAGTRRSAR